MLPSLVNGELAGSTGVTYSLNAMRKDLVLRMTRLREGRRAGDGECPMLVHAAAAVDEQANRRRRIGVGEQTDGLRLAVLDDVERVLRQATDVRALPVSDGHVQHDELGVGRECRRLLTVNDVACGGSESIAAAECEDRDVQQWWRSPPSVYARLRAQSDSPSPIARASAPSTSTVGVELAVRGSCVRAVERARSSARVSCAALALAPPCAASASACCARPLASPALASARRSPACALGSVHA